MPTAGIYKTSLNSLHLNSSIFTITCSQLCRYYIEYGYRPILFETMSIEWQNNVPILLLSSPPTF